MEMKKDKELLRRAENFLQLSCIIRTYIHTHTHVHIKLDINIYIYITSARH